MALPLLRKKALWVSLWCGVVILPGVASPSVCEKKKIASPNFVHLCPAFAESISVSLSIRKW